jgi:ribosomal protein S18 acetylase RimI-like enzyme
VDVINRNLYYYSLSLVRDLDNIPNYNLPEGYRFVLFNDGDEKDWVEIEKSSGEFLSYDEGIESFNYYFGKDYDNLKKMCLFIENDKGEKVATSTAFYLDKPIDDITGVVHWAAVKKEYQGKHLAKPLISRTLQLLKELGHKKAILYTQTHTWLAVKIYLDMGFDPYNIDEEYKGWQIVKKIINHDKLSSVGDISSDDMYNPLYVQAYDFLKSNYSEPFIYKVWDELGPVIGVNKDDQVHYYKYSFENGKLDIISENEEYKRLVRREN